MYAPIHLTDEEVAALREIDAEFDLEAALDQREPQFNIAPTQKAPVLALGEPGLEVKALRWGLVPAWAKDLKIGAHAINARVETVAEKPMFRAAYKKRRCLVPASGYYEWRVENGAKQPYFIHAPDRRLMLFAGLWEAWKPKDDEAAEWVKTFTVITGLPGKVSGDIHDRQPVILPPGDWELWLEGTHEDADAILAGVPEAELTYYPVSKAVVSPKNKGPELVQPVTL